ncbi:hypothetical protein Dimus_008439 [Dionaea muscipula]
MTEDSDEQISDVEIATQTRRDLLNRIADDDRLRIIKESSVPTSGRTTNSNLDSVIVHDIEDDLMADRVEHSFTLGGDKEMPFDSILGLDVNSYLWPTLGWRLARYSS